jgi:thiol-disulfide isomerase/thioredoxin
VSRRARPALLAAAGLLLVTGCASGSSDDVGQPSGRGSADPPQMVQSTPYVVPACPQLPHRTAVPGGLPDLTLPCLGAGPDVRLADLRGTPTVLNVWAAWCPPCADEMPLLSAGQRRAGDRVRFFGIHYKAPTAFAKRSAKDFGLRFPSVQDADGDRTTLAFRPLAGPPQTFFYTADGHLAGRHPGAITTRAQLDELVQQYLGVTL